MTKLGHLSALSVGPLYVEFHFLWSVKIPDIRFWFKFLLHVLHQIPQWLPAKCEAFPACLHGITHPLLVLPTKVWGLLLKPDELQCSFWPNLKYLILNITLDIKYSQEYPLHGSSALNGLKIPGGEVEGWVWVSVMVGV